MDKTTPKYVLVENYIRKAIRTRQITGRLPGERRLAKDLGYSYMTVRKAIDNLVTEGVIYKVPTKGTFVADGKKNRKSHRTIGFFLDSSIKAGLSSPYYSLIFNAIEKEAAARGYAVLYFSESSENRLNKILDKLDGVIAACFPRIDDIIHEIRESTPVVVIDNASSDKSIPSVIIDNFNALVDSVEYIFALGHQRIAFMTGLGDSDVGRDRYAGYRNGLNRNHLARDNTLVYHGDYSFASGIDGADYYLGLDEPPTAIICANDSMALGAITRYHRSGLAIPRACSIVGFDDIEVAAQVIPPLTTIAAPVAEIAKHSISALEALIQGRKPDNRHIALRAELVVRESCAQKADDIAVA